MGWWKLSGDSDLVMGDQAADVMAAVLEELASLARPSLDQFLDALEAALRNLPCGLGSRGICDPDVPRHRATPDAELAAHLEAGMQRVSDSYVKYVGRPAKTAELLEVASFVLGPAPGKYLEGAPSELGDLALEP